MFGFLRRFRKEHDETTAAMPEETPVDVAASAVDSQETSPEVLEQAEPAETPASLDAEPAVSLPVAKHSRGLFGFPPKPKKEEDDKPSFFASLGARLARTREGLTEGLASLLLGKKQIDDELLEEIETRLLLADVGMETTRLLIDELTRKVKRKDLSSPEALFESLHAHMVQLLQPAEQPLQIDTTHKPAVILVVGINGAGKTTSIGKIGLRLSQEGKKVILAAGDTFRAAAVEQLQTWGERTGIPVIAQASGADSAGVIFDALQAARARSMDVLIADTAGRLHTQGGLMDELKKVKRVLTKLDASAPHEVLLVLDASIGQNALNQAVHFHQALGVTGLVVTKLDGTAKAGILFAITHQLGLPVRYIGVGERAEDLRPFVARDFADALLDREAS